MHRTGPSSRTRRFLRERAIVLAHRDGPRSARWIWFYTEQSGVLEAIAECARRPRRHWTGTLLPLNYGQLTYRLAHAETTARLISFDLEWSPYLRGDLHRLAGPAGLGLTSYCAELTCALLTGMLTDTFLFQQLMEISHLLITPVPMRALAVAWTWQVLCHHGELVLHGGCTACGQMVQGTRQPLVWTVSGQIWHPQCRTVRDAHDLTVDPEISGILHCLRSHGIASIPPESPAWSVLARWTPGWTFLRARVETILGRPLRSLQVMADLAATPSQTP